MKVLSVEVHNVMKISDVSLDLSGHHLFIIGGGNGNGKTSLLKAIACVLCGKRVLGSDWPDVLLKDGKDRGYVRVNMSGDESLHEDDQLTAELLLRRKRGGVVVEEFRVLDSSGEEAPEARTLLNRLYQMRAFDPLEFEKSKPKERVELLCKLIGLDLDVYRDRRAELYASRTVVNRELKNKDGALDVIEFPAGTPEEYVSVTSLVGELRDAEDHNSSIEASKKHLNGLLESESRLNEEEARLKARLEEIDKERQQLDHAISDEELLLNTAKPIDTNTIKEKISSSEKINRDVAQRKRRQELLKEREVLVDKSLELTNLINDLDETRHEALERCVYPIPEMKLDEAGVLLNGLPFEQASKAERVVASVKIGMALNPTLRLLMCQDGNDLDDTTMAALESALVSGDFQLLLECVTRDEAEESRCAVVFEEGTAKAAVVH